MTIYSVGRIGFHRLPYGTQPSKKQFGSESIKPDQNAIREKVERHFNPEAFLLTKDGLNRIGMSGISDETLMQANMMVQALVKKLLILADRYPENLKASLKVLIRAIGTVSKTVPEAKLRYYKLKELEQMMLSLTKEQNESGTSLQPLLMEQGAVLFNPINGLKESIEGSTGKGFREFEPRVLQKAEVKRTAMTESLEERQTFFDGKEIKPLHSKRRRRPGFLSGSLNIKA